MTPWATRSAASIQPRSYRLGGKHCPSLIAKRNQFHATRFPADEQALQKCRIARTNVSCFSVEARILLTTVAGRSSMDRMAEGIEHMVIETVLFIAFVVIVGAAVVKAYECTM